MVSPLLGPVLSSPCVEPSVVSSKLIGGSGSASLPSLEFDDLLSESVLSASVLGVCLLGSTVELVLSRLPSSLSASSSVEAVSLLELPAESDGLVTPP